MSTPWSLEVNHVMNVLIDRIEQEYFLYCSNFVVNRCFWISNPHTYHIWFKRDRAVKVPMLTDMFGGSRATATSKIECFVIIVNGFQPLTIITKHSILDVAAALDPPHVVLKIRVIIT